MKVLLKVKTLRKNSETLYPPDLLLISWRKSFRIHPVSDLMVSGVLLVSMHSILLSSVLSYAMGIPLQEYDALDEAATPEERLIKQRKRLKKR